MCSQSTSYDHERWDTLSLVGNLADLGLGDIFQIVSLSRRSGTLQLTTPVESGEIVFRAGRVVAAFRSNAKNSIGEDLLAEGVLAPNSYQDMLAAQRNGKRGPELFNLTGVNPEALQETLENVLKHVIYTMFEWNEGTFSFVLEDSPDIWRGFALEGARAVAENGLNPQYLAIEGARIRDEKAKEDTLSTFLLKAQEPSESHSANSALDVKEIAAKLRNAAELDSLPEHSVNINIATPPLKSFEPAKLAKIEDTITIQKQSNETEIKQVPSATIESNPVKTIDNSVSLLQTAGQSLSTLKTNAGYRLLAIDDDPLVTKYIRDAFADNFVEITTSESVSDAFNEIEKDPENLVIASDLIIARSDGKGILGGIEILEKIRQRWSNIPVVLFTDYQNEEAETRAKNLGALATLQKPRKAQVQAAIKQGGQEVFAEFIVSLSGVLAPYIKTASNDNLDQKSETLNLTTTASIQSAPILTTDSSTANVNIFVNDLPSPIKKPAMHETLSNEIAAKSLPDSDNQEELSLPEHSSISSKNNTFANFDLSTAISSEIDALGVRFENDLPPPMLSAGDMAILRSMLAELVDPSNRETVTLLVLRFASHLVERAGLFLATRRVFVGLGGFSIDEASDQFVSRVRRIQIPVEIESIFSRVCHFRSMIRAPLKDCDGNRRLIEGLSGTWPTNEAVAAPLISGDRVAAILFGDNPSGKALGLTDSLEIFLQQAGLAMDRALLERKLEDSRKYRSNF